MEVKLPPFPKCLIGPAHSTVLVWEYLPAELFSQDHKPSAYRAREGIGQSEKWCLWVKSKQPPSPCAGCQCSYWCLAFSAFMKVRYMKQLSFFLAVLWKATILAGEALPWPCVWEPMQRDSEVSWLCRPSPCQRHSCCLAPDICHQGRVQAEAGQENLKH